MKERETNMCHTYHQGILARDTKPEVIIIAALILLSSESKLIIPKILLQEFWE